MHYIIDGCNFIKRHSGSSPFDFEGEKRRFISRLDRYLLGKQVKVTLVFDSSVPSFESAGRMKVIHEADADARIVSEVKTLNSASSAVVVTDDREILKAVRGEGAKTMGVGEFDEFLSKRLKEGGGRPGGSTEKPSPEHMTEEEIREWEDFFRRKNSRRV